MYSDYSPLTLHTTRIMNTNTITCRPAPPHLSECNRHVKSKEENESMKECLIIACLFYRSFVSINQSGFDPSGSQGLNTTDQTQWSDTDQPITRLLWGHLSFDLRLHTQIVTWQAPHTLSHTHQQITELSSCTTKQFTHRTLQILSECLTSGSKPMTCDCSINSVILSGHQVILPMRRFLSNPAGS